MVWKAKVANHGLRKDINSSNVIKNWKVKIYQELPGQSHNIEVTKNYKQYEVFLSGCIRFLLHAVRNFVACTTRNEASAKTTRSASDQ